VNLLLLDPAEVAGDGRATLSDGRARHLVAVLGAAPGRRVRAGLLDGPVGEAEILDVEAGAGRVRLRCFFTGGPPPRPALDLVLAMPRPKVLKRLWAPLAAAGVANIFIVNAAKVERMYFDSDALDPALVRRRLIDGLAQAGDTRLPVAVVRRRLKPFVEDELGPAPAEGERRILAHPGVGARVADRVRRGERVLLAVGPEGGWTDYERDLLARHGFEPVTMGARVLRSDHAALALLALARDAQGWTMDNEGRGASE